MEPEGPDLPGVDPNASSQDPHARGELAQKHHSGVLAPRRMLDEHVL